MSITKLNNNESGCITYVPMDFDFKHFGIREGKTVRKITKQPMGQMIVFKIDNRTFAINENLIKDIEVDVKKVS